MRWIVLGVTLLVFGVSVSVASACSCILPQGPRADLEGADAAFYGQLVDREDLGHGQVTYRFRVDDDYKENLDSEVTVSTGTQSSTCGLDLEQGQMIGLLLRAREGGYSAGSCSVRSREQLEAGRAPAPTPTPSPTVTPRPSVTPVATPEPAGAVAYYVAGGPDGARSATLDAEGAVVGRAGGPGVATAVAACPGGATVLEAARSHGRAVVVARDVASLAVRRRASLPRGTVRHLACLSGDGARATLLLDAAGSPRDRLITLAREGRQTVWRGAARSAVFTARRAWVSDGRAVRIVDLVTGRDRRLLRIRGRELALAPDGRAVAIATSSGVSVVDASDGRVLARARRPSGASLAWISAERLVTAGAARGAILDRALAVVSRLPRPTRALATSAGGLALVDAAGRLRRYDPDGQPIGAPRSLGISSVIALASVPAARARSALDCSKTAAWRTGSPRGWWSADRLKPSVNPALGPDAV